MAAKKCKCEKCGYCKQIYYTANKWVVCEKYNETVAPTYCDKFITIEDYKIEQKAKQDYERQMKHMEYVWAVTEMKRGK